MKIDGINYRTIWVKPNDNKVIQIIDQRELPHNLVIEDLTSVDDIVEAITDMHVRGAPLIGVTAAYGMYLATIEAVESGSFGTSIEKSIMKLRNSRPTAVDLYKAINFLLIEIAKAKTPEDKITTALKTAHLYTVETVWQSKKIGEIGVELIDKLSKSKNGETVNILTHCNAGWLATVDYGTATSPIYHAFERGIDIHVWVDETRPRNQGASLTAFELGKHGISHTVITDSTGGHLMQHDMVDMVIVGTDRTTYTGDVANKIGTYLKALAAKDNNVPFYVAAPSSSIDFNLKDGIREIPIEERGTDEVRFIQGLHEGTIKKVLLTPEDSPAANYGFDVTPARLVTGIITERGICEANEDSILSLFPEYKK
jgi:methylthioribose-1-phosphate isomerase